MAALGNGKHTKARAPLDQDVDKSSVKSEDRSVTWGEMQEIMGTSVQIQAIHTIIIDKIDSMNNQLGEKIESMNSSFTERLNKLEGTSNSGAAIYHTKRKCKYYKLPLNILQGLKWFLK